MRLAVHLHDIGVLGDWKRKLLKSARFWKITFPFAYNKNVNLWRRWSCTFITHSRMCITCLQDVSWQSQISNYWPGMQNTAFLVIFADPCEQG